MTTHEDFINQIAAIVIARLATADADRLHGLKLVYGAGEAGLRGVTYFNRWQNGGEHAHSFVEVTAFGEEGWLQLASTTIHELAHVLAGQGAGHSSQWRDACDRLGLRLATAAGHVYTMAGFAPDIRQAIAEVPKPDDGAPVTPLGARFGPGIKLRPCGAGVGTRGGKSRGKHSGSRLRLFECDCTPPIKVRAARDDLDWTCNACGTAANRV